MNDLKLKELEINAFRGIKHEDLKLDSKSLVLLGENGTGKSSIVQSIEYLLTSKVGALEGKGRGDLRQDVAIRFFGKNASDLNVKATFSNDLTIERNTTGLYGPDEIKSIIKQLSNGSNILNRKKLLDYVDSQPKERYIEIGKLIGFTDIDNTGEIFKKERNALENTLVDKKFDYTNSIRALSNKLNVEFKLRYKNQTKKNKVLNYEALAGQYEKCIEELNRKIEGKFPQLENDTNIEEYLKDLQETLNSNGKQQAKTILDSIKEIDNLNSKEEELNQILSRYELLYFDSAKNANLLLNILDSSREYITANNSTTCPVCKSDINPQQISEEIGTEIDELRDKFSSIEILKEETLDFIDYLENLNENYRLIKNQIKQLDEKDILDLQRENIASIEKLISDLESVSNFELNAKEIETPLTKSNSKLMDISKYLESSYFGDDKEYQETIDLLNQSLILLINLNKTQNDIDALEKEFEVAETVVNTYETEKVKFIGDTLEKLTERINKYYGFIHGKDKIKNPRFEVSGPTGLKLKMDSFDEESDPREYSSEGHLDTLGMCIFLAFVRENSTVPILVLDDIVATVDSSHKERIARLLLDEFYDHQLIITTHNKMWFNQIKHLVKARQRHHKNNIDYDDYQFVEITSWNLDEGPHLSNHKTDMETINKHMENNDLVAAVHASRRYLENILRNICITNEAKITYKEKPYFLLEYLKAAKKEIGFHTKGSDFEQYYDDIFFELEQARFLGNSFVHGDEDDDLTLNDANTFCNSVYELHKAVTCEKCGSYIEFNKFSGKGRCTNRQCSSTFEMTEDE